MGTSRDELIQLLSHQPNEPILAERIKDVETEQPADLTREQMPSKGSGSFAGAAQASPGSNKAHGSTTYKFWTQPIGEVAIS